MRNFQKRKEEKRGSAAVAGKTTKGIKSLEKRKYPQKCWNCKNVYGGCSWSRSFIPVKGWTAKKVHLEGLNKRILESYAIRDCPEFVPDRAYY